MTGYVRITDGTTYINLFGAKAGFQLKDWRPAAGGDARGGGIWQESPFAEGRRPVIHTLNNITDNFTLAVNGQCMDGVIKDTQELRRLLMKAIQYWTTEWQNEPVWIEARGAKETNARYAIIYSYSAPFDDNPFEMPFYGGRNTVLDDFVLSIEHGLWLASRPGVGECTPISSSHCWNYPWHLEFNGLAAGSRVDLGSDVSLGDLADNAFTAEAWVKANGYGAANAGMIFNKTNGAAEGWYLGISVNGLIGTVRCAVTNASSTSGTDEFDADGQWHHVAMTWDDAADRYIYLYIDGNPVASYASLIQGNGAIVADAARNLYIGNRTGLDTTWNGSIGWARISNNARYAFVFDPPPRCAIPDWDARTIWLGISEGYGNTVYNRGDPVNDGTTTNCTWNGDCCE